MSVINKVLRDLDNRAVGADRLQTEGPSDAAGAQLPPGVVAVPPLTPLPASPRLRPTGLAGLLLSVLGMGLAIWWWLAPRPSGTVPQTPAAVAVPAPQVPLAPAPAEALPTATFQAAVPGGGASVAVIAPGVPRPAVSAPIPAPVAPPATPAPAVPVSAPVRIARATPAPSSAPAPAAVTPQVTPAPVQIAPVPVPAAASKPANEPPAAAAPSPVPWQEAALDAVGQAQRLWGSGARDTALAFLRDALGGVERAHGPDLVPERAGAAAGLAMVRELVRMEQTLGNLAQVLALLKRHEALVARHADLWAVRGSAAQRLSQHAEAADAYRTALRLRPGESRWMLGAAVSLAALGRVGDATQLLEQARAIGPVSPDVLSYLRQLGVQARSDNQAN